ncbi:MAG: NAD(P)-dependent alcohol dehydrogenase [Roseibium sp.]|uniref:zinc-dependent alcohol dehydrogenase family protein n=1 Tax=Roseibium sp. TaxID=1936156 RepID=UPI003D9C25A0
MSQKWMLKPGEGPDSLRLVDLPPEPLSSGSVRVALKAWSLNARDFMVAHGQSPVPVAPELIPLSDAAGIVEEVANDVVRVRVGDRVVVTFNPAHQSGSFEPHMAAHAHGEMAQGLLARERVVDQMAVVKLTDNLTLEQAACLPCAAVTVWNALFEAGPLFPGQTVLATGTGTISLTAMQLAKAAGARFGITSSDPAKLEKAMQLGADFGVNYRKRPDWDVAVKEATDGKGADVVLETAGPPSVATAVRAAAQNGRVAQIGLKAMDGPAISMLDLMLSGVRVVPIMVGSRVMLERVVAAASVNALNIPVEESFPFADAHAAFYAAASGTGFGKIVISN